MTCTDLNVLEVRGGEGTLRCPGSMLVNGGYGEGTMNGGRVVINSGSASLLGQRITASLQGPSATLTMSNTNRVLSGVVTIKSGGPF